MYARSHMRGDGLRVHHGGERVADHARSNRDHPGHQQLGPGRTLRLVRPVLVASGGRGMASPGTTLQAVRTRLSANAAQPRANCAAPGEAIAGNPDGGGEARTPSAVSHPVRIADGASCCRQHLVSRTHRRSGGPCRRTWRPGTSRRLRMKSGAVPQVACCGTPPELRMAWCRLHDVA